MRQLTRLVIFTLSLLCIASTGIKVRNVLIIGDSISNGYTPFVQKALAPTVNVKHNPGNGGSTRRGIDSLDVWLGDKQWEVVLFNFGLHDLVRKDSFNKHDVTCKVAITLDEYQKNLDLIVARLRKTKATIIFVNTTEVPENSSGKKVEDPANYNAVAKDVMNKYGVELVDLYTASLTIHPQNSKPGNVHYTSKGYELLAGPIIKAINTALLK